jgi:hypothetical protein
LTNSKNLLHCFLCVFWLPRRRIAKMRIFSTPF